MERTDNWPFDQELAAADVLQTESPDSAESRIATVVNIQFLY